MKRYKNVIILCVLAAMAIGYYFYLANRPGTDPTDKAAVTTKIQDTLSKDVKTITNTPRSAVKFYSIILQCLYNEVPSDAEIAALGNKARELLDEELVKNNPEASYFNDLNAELNEYSEAKRIVMSYAVESGDDVEYYTEADREYAIVNASYTLRETEDFTKTNEEYILRKDEEGYWKILGWRVAVQAVADDQNEDE
jgi:hypothetical protein